MTIDSTWLHSFKAETREAFTKKAPFRHTAVFSDGQIRLMQGGASRSGIQTWDEYVRRQFLWPLSRFLDTCDTVILAFDCYDHVPPAKCMTQLKRRRHVPPTDFGEHSCLPPCVPQGEAWAGAIGNRSFKAKVIEMVLLSLPAWLLRDRPTKRLIVDYTVRAREPLATCAACDGGRPAAGPDRHALGSGASSGGPAGARRPASPGRGGRKVHAIC